jgi:hypothetical protein
MSTLRDFTKVMLIDEAVYNAVTEITAMYAFACTFFRKFNDIWGQAAVSGDRGLEEGLKETAWLWFVITRLKLAARSCEVALCANVLIGVLQYVLLRLPPSITTGLDHDNLGLELSRLLKATPSSAAAMASRVEDFISSVVTEVGLKHEGVGQADSIKYNLANLSMIYQELLQPDDFDERDFLSSSLEPNRRLPKLPLTPFKRQGKAVGPSTALARRLEWDEVDSSVGLTSALKDLKFRTVNSPYLHAGTPMTLAMEMNTWLDDLTEAIGDDLASQPSLLEVFADDAELMVVIKAKVDFFLTSLTAQLNAAGVGQPYSSDFLNTHFAVSLPASTEGNCKAQLTVKLYLKALEKLVSCEQAKLPSSIRSIVENTSFHTALLACCLETVLFVHNLSAVDLHDILRLTEVSAFDLWTLIDNFAGFDPRMPVSLRCHLRDIETQIICELGWAPGSPVVQVISQLILSQETPLLQAAQEAGEGDVTSKAAALPDKLHPFIPMFFRRTLSHAALRILELSDALRLEDSVKEEVWTATKHALSDHTELLIGRHIDQVIICSICGVCRILRPVSFNAVLECYAELYTDEARLAIQTVKSEGGTSMSIVVFYNTSYQDDMKEYFTALHTRSQSSFHQPRISALSPASPLRANLPTVAMMSHRPSPARSPFRSPYMSQHTNPSRAVWDNSADRRLDFDTEERGRGSAKALEELLKNEEQPDLPFSPK